MNSRQVRWFDFHEWVQPYLDAAGEWPMVGSQAWFDLPDDDPRKFAAICDAAQHFALRLETCQQARAEASRAVSAAEDWTQVAREIRNREEFRAARPWMDRRAS